MVAPVPLGLFCLCLYVLGKQTVLWPSSGRILKPFDVGNLHAHTKHPSVSFEIVA
jgi:hypothetical protein